MSEPTYRSPGSPDASWTPADIKRHIIGKLGLVEYPGAQQRAYEEIERQFEAGEQFGFYKDRIYWIAELQEQYENGCWAFHNRGCPHCWRSPHPQSCIKIWKRNDGTYVTSQCGAAMTDFEPPDAD